MKANEYKTDMNRNFNDPELEASFVRAAQGLEQIAAVLRPRQADANGMTFTSPGAYKAYMNGGEK